MFLDVCEILKILNFKFHNISLSEDADLIVII